MISEHGQYEKWHSSCNVSVRKVVRALLRQGALMTNNSILMSNDQTSPSGLLQKLSPVLSYPFYFPRETLLLGLHFGADARDADHGMPHLTPTWLRNDRLFCFAISCP